MLSGKWRPSCLGLNVLSKCVMMMTKPGLVNDEIYLVESFFPVFTRTIEISILDLIYRSQI